MSNNVVDTKVLLAIEKLIEEGHAISMQEMFDNLCISKGNFYDIKKGRDRHFTVMQIYNLVTIYGINPNYIFGTDKKIFTESTIKSSNKNK